MTRTLLLGGLLALGGLSLTVAAYQAPAAPKVVEVEKLRDNLFVLKGGGGSEHFALGSDPGADTVSGGPGTDTADYASAATGVDVSLDGAANDGTPGEGDNVGPLGDVEQVTGSAWVDLLTGGPNGDVLTGGDGQDEIAAMGGDDTIYTVGDGLKDFVDGGDGTDTGYLDRIDSSVNVEFYL